jgi:hypothetical protein
VEGGAAERYNSTLAHGHTWNIKENSRENQFAPCVYVNTVAVFVYAASVDIAFLVCGYSRRKTIVFIIPTWW